MRTRVVSIEIEENADGRLRKVRQRYPAEALLLLDAPTAGEGFLAIVKDLVAQLDGPPPRPAPPPPPEPPRPLTREEEIERITTRRKVKPKMPLAQTKL